MQAVPERRDVPLNITVDGEPTRSETVATSVGAYVLTIATTLPDLAVDVHSTYSGHEQAGTIAAHLILAREACQAIAEQHEHDLLPLTHERRRCLYDHLHRLQEALEDLDMHTSIPVSEDAISAIER